MNNLVHADIFFFITTIVVAVAGIVGLIAAIYVIAVLKNVKEISDRIKEEGIEIVDEISEWRAHISKSGFGIGTLLMFLQKMFGKKQRSARDVKAEPVRKKKALDDEDEE